MKNVLVLTYWSYKDALVQTYTLPYVRIMQNKIPPSSKIFLLTLEQDFFKMKDKDWESEKEKLALENIILIRFKYDHFGIKMTFRIITLLFSLIKLIRKENIKFIHCWCMSAGALGYMLSLLTSKPLIIDSYEPHATSMVENGTWNRSSLKFKILYWLEKKQSQKADCVVALTEGMRTYAYENYQATFKKYFVKPSLIDLQKFSWNESNYLIQREEKNLANKIVCVYAGKLGGIYLKDEVFDFIKVACDHWKTNFQMFLLTDSNIDEINTLIEQKNIPKECIETKFVEHHKINSYFQIADFAINPVKPVPSKRYCTSIKDGEYWAMGLPVIITNNISDDSGIIESENIGYVLKKLSLEEYKSACHKIDELLQLDKNQLAAKIMNIAKKYRSIQIAETIYKEIYS